MELGRLVNWSVARCRPGLCLVLFALVFAFVSGFSPRPDSECAAKRDSALTYAAAQAQGLQGPAMERLETGADRVVDPLENDDLASEPRLGPALQSQEASATSNCRPTPLDSRWVSSCNPARGPPSA